MKQTGFFTVSNGIEYYNGKQVSRPRFFGRLLTAKQMKQLKKTMDKYFKALDGSKTQH